MSEHMAANGSLLPGFSDDTGSDMINHINGMASCLAPEVFNASDYSCPSIGASIQA